MPNSVAILVGRPNARIGLYLARPDGSLDTRPSGLCLADVQMNDAGVQLIPLQREPPDGDRESEPPMTGGSRVHVEHTVALVDGGFVTVAVDNDAHARRGRVQVELLDDVQEIDEGAGRSRRHLAGRMTQVDDFTLRQAGREFPRVRVAAHRANGCDLGEGIEDRGVADVPRMEDQVASGQCVQRLRADQAVGVGDESDRSQESFLSRRASFEERRVTRRVAVLRTWGTGWAAPARPATDPTRQMELTFHTLDVFTDRTFGGNPLGVFPDATHLPTDLMQRIAREMNLSETVFLGPPETPEGSARVRIFTPGVEVPFAGHPTVGTAIFLAARGMRGAEGAPSQGDSDAAIAGTATASQGDSDAAIAGAATTSQGDSDAATAGTAGASAGNPDPPADMTLILEENVGPVPVSVRFEDGRPVFAQFTTALLPEHRPSPFSRAELAAMVGLGEADVCSGGLEPEMVSCGLPYHVIPVATIDAIRRAVLDMSRWTSMLAESWAHHVYLVCLDGEGDGVDVRVRMFAPGSGVPEDPATGSAAAALGGYLSKVDGSEQASLSWTVEQGIEIGRPSLIFVEADREDGETSAVRVGGSAVLVSSGTMRVPE